MPAEQTTKWTRERLTIMLDLYCRTPFGRLPREILMLPRLIRSLIVKGLERPA